RVLYPLSAFRFIYFMQNLDFLQTTQITRNNCKKLGINNEESSFACHLGVSLGFKYASLMSMYSQFLFQVFDFSFLVFFLNLPIPMDSLKSGASTTVLW